jgi:DNA-binding NarL/FixJ family response regulator
MNETNWLWRPRVVVAEDCEMMARTISRIVQLHCDVVRVVRDGQSAIDTVLELQPDVLVLDIQMPVLDGIQVVRRLRALNGKSRIVMLTGYEDQQFIDASIIAGANGFVFKSRMTGDLLRAIGEVLAERTFVSKHSRWETGEPL